MDLNLAITILLWDVKVQTIIYFNLLHLYYILTFFFNYINFYILQQVVIAWNYNSNYWFESKSILPSHIQLPPSIKHNQFLQSNSMHGIHFFSLIFSHFLLPFKWLFKFPTSLISLLILTLETQMILYNGGMGSKTFEMADFFFHTLFIDLHMFSPYFFITLFIYLFIFGRETLWGDSLSS